MSAPFEPRPIHRGKAECPHHEPGDNDKIDRRQQRKMAYAERQILKLTPYRHFPVPVIEAQSAGAGAGRAPDTASSRRMDWTSLCCVWRCSYHSYPTRRNRVPRTPFGHLVGVCLDAADAAARISGVWVRRSRFPVRAGAARRCALARELIRNVSAADFRGRINVLCPGDRVWHTFKRLALRVVPRSNKVEPSSAYRRYFAPGY